MYYLPFIIKFSIYKIKNLLSLKKKKGKLDDENNFFNSNTIFVRRRY